MATYKITKSFVDKIEFEKTGQKIYRDASLIGFALRVTQKSKTYIAERRKEGKNYRIAIGKHFEITATEARTKAESILTQIGTGEDPRKPQKIKKHIPTLIVAYQEYINERSLKGKTLISYNKQIKNYLADFQDVRLSEITRQDIVVKFKEITKVSPAQANASMRLLRAIYTWAEFTYTDENEQPLLKDNPIKILTAKKLWNNIKAKTSYLEEDDAGNFFNALLNYQDETRWHNKPYANNARDLYLLIMLTGIRLDEGQCLQWDRDVDMKKGLLIFHDPKNGDNHQLPMGDFLFEIFKLRYAQKGSEWVFPSRQNEGQHITNMRAGLATLNQKAGTNITTHDLRRTYASIANHLDYSVATIKRLLNHRDSSRQNDVTLRYIQMSTKKLKQAMNDIEQQLFEYSSVTLSDAVNKLKASN